MKPNLYVRRDCRNYKGDQPCFYNLTCLACQNYQTQGKKILIIKLAAVGDVLRTTPILSGLRKKYHHSFVTWITQAEAVGLLENNSGIDRLLVYDLAAVERLKAEKFDILICLDKEIEAVVLANQIKAKNKFGFGFDSKTGNVIPYNKESRYAWELGLSNELKFHQNKKTYPQLIFDIAKLNYKNEEYILNISDLDNEYTQRQLDKIGVDRDKGIVGLNTGAGGRFANKAWTEEGFVELIRLIQDHTDMQIFLLGGPRERRRNARIISQVGSSDYDIGCGHSLRQFAAIINTCSLIVSADTTALHIAIALKKFVVALFGPTCDQEIDLYGRGLKVISPIECRPCYRRQCVKEINCMNLIKPDNVFVAIEKLIIKCTP